MLARIYNHLLAPKIRFARASVAARSQGMHAIRVLGGNMEPTLRLGDVALYKADGLDAIGRGEVVVVQHAHYFGGDAVPLRIIGLPGDSIEIHDGQLLVNGQAAAEPYLFAASAESEYSTQFASTSVPEAHAFMLGDCRDNSNDSRLLGAIPLAAVVGKVKQAHALDSSNSRRAIR